MSAAELVRLFAARSLSVAVAESLTGGMVCSELVAVPGASAVVRGGVVSYATEVKIDLLGVPAELVAEHGVVSAACAEAMARGVRRAVGADVGLATTGVAGPQRQDGHPVGTVFVAIAWPGPQGLQCQVRRLALSGDRESIRRGAVDALLVWAHEVISGQVAREQSGLG